MYFLALLMFSKAEESKTHKPSQNTVQVVAVIEIILIAKRVMEVIVCFLNS